MDLGSWIDGGLTATLRQGKRLPLFDPVAKELGRHRKKRLPLLTLMYQMTLSPQIPLVLDKDPMATATYDEILAEAVGNFRKGEPRSLFAPFYLVDRLLYKNSAEILDDPSFPEEARVHTIDCIDWLNKELGSYERWLSMLLPLIKKAEQGSRPVRIVDLAAGHGGFAIYLKQALGARISITATDVMAAYLELGRRRAAENRVDVDFAVQDATDLRNFSSDQPPVDIFLCTQTLHHFPAGMVARIMGQAAAYARVGAAFLDGDRALLPLLLLPLVMAAKGRTWPVFHDTWVSLRRLYSVEELEFLANLAPGMPPSAKIVAERIRPGYALLQIQVLP